MDDILILAIETATGCSSVSLTKGTITDGTVLAECTLQPDIKHSRRLLGTIKTMMQAAGTDWADLCAVAVSQGPGSFTGLRIGMAAGKGFALAANIPLIAVPTLDGLAAQVTVARQQVCCLLDARKGQVYAAFYRSGTTHAWHRTSDYMVCSAEDLNNAITEPTLVLGPGIRVCRPLLSANPLVEVAPVGPFHPRAALIGFCAAQQLEQDSHDRSVDPEPLYVRASEAEMNRQPGMSTSGNQL